MRISRKDFEVESLSKQLEQARAQLEIEKRNLKRAEIKCPIDGVALQRAAQFPAQRARIAGVVQPHAQ